MSAVQFTYQSADGKPALLLSAAGPYVPIEIGAPGDAPRKALPALIETGSAASCIDRALARELGLRLIDRRSCRGAAGEVVLDVYLARLVIPAVGYDRMEAFLAVELGPNWPILLGRDVLGSLVFTYDGVNGIVTVSG